MRAWTRYGRCFADLASRVTRRDPRGSARLPVDRVFTLKGFGTIATGTLVSGRLREGQNLAVLPRALSASARGIQVHGHQQPAADAGHRVAVNLGGIELADLERGATLCEPGSLEPTRRFDVMIELLPDTRPLRHGARVRFHQGTSEIMGRVALAARRGTVEPLAELPPGASAYARLRLEQPAVVTRADRFILRAYSPAVTIGGGVILDPLPPRAAIRTPIGIERLHRLDASAPFDEVLETLVEERGLQGLPQSAVLSRAGAAPAQAEASLRRLSETRKIVAVGDVLLSRRLMDQAANRLLEALTAHHAAEPMSEGLHREEARAKLMPRALPAVFDAIVAPLVAAGRVTSRDRLSLAGHAVSLSPEEGRVREAVLKVFSDAGLAPPDVAGARSAVGGDAATVDRIINLLVRQRVLVKVDTLLFHSGTARGAQNGDTSVEDDERSCRRAIRRGIVQGALRYHAEVRDSAAGISGPRAGHTAGGGVESAGLAAIGGTWIFCPVFNTRALLGRVLEILDATADPAPDVRQPVGAENQDDYEEDDN